MHGVRYLTVRIVGPRIHGTAVSRRHVLPNERADGRDGCSCGLCSKGASTTRSDASRSYVRLCHAAELYEDEL